MKSTIVILIFALSAMAGVLTLNWDPVEGDFSTLEIRANEAVLKIINAEDGVFPDSAEIPVSYYVIPAGCIGCGICINECPVNAITMDDNNIAVIDPEICINCGICAGSCPTATIELPDAEDFSLYGIDAEGNEELLKEGFQED